MAWPNFSAKKVFFDAVAYSPTVSQLPTHQSEARHLLIGGGERAGKSRATAMEAFGCFPAWTLLYIVGETYENALPEFDYIRDYFALLGELTQSKLIVREYRPPSGQQRSSLDLNIGGSFKRVITVSTQRRGGQAVARKGEAPDLILLVEFGVLPYDVYLAARARVAEKRGRVILSGTFPDDTGWQAQQWRRWRGANDEGGEAFSVPTWSNLEIFPGGWDDPEIKALRAIYPEAEFMRRFGAEPQKPATLVFPEFSYADHVQEWVEYESGQPVEVWIDPGYGESFYTVLAVQMASPFVFVIDEVYVAGMFGEAVIEECKNRPWWGDVRGGVADVAGKQHHATESQIEVWRAKAGISLRSQRVSLAAGRDRLNSFLMKHPETGIPRLLFSTKCKETAGEFTKYAWKKRSEERLAGEEPVNKYCDAIKALTYGLFDHFGPVEYPSMAIPMTTPREELWRRAFRMTSKTD